MDTAGQDEYSIFNSKHAIGIHGYILVYSIASIQSFEMIQTIREKILNYAGMDWVPIVIVGNKSDLFTQRQVTVEQVKQLSLDWKCCFIETSAKLNQNIQKVFEMMICEIEKPNETNESCVLL